MKSAFTVGFILIVIQGSSQPSISLRKTFVDSFNNNVTMSAQSRVWNSHHKANRAAKDGDMHSTD